MSMYQKVFKKITFCDNCYILRRNTGVLSERKNVGIHFCAFEPVDFSFHWGEKRNGSKLKYL